MTDTLDNAAAIVGVGAILPDAPDAPTFWRNVTTGRYSVTEVDPQRWDPALYYDPDPSAPEKTYSTLGGWVRDWDWNPLGWKLPIPPRVSEGMDDCHKWAVACTRMALMDAGWPERPFDQDRTAVIIGSAIAGEQHYLTTIRIMFPELARELDRTESFAALPADVRQKVEGELKARFAGWLPEITEDTMPGELANCIAGRVANLFNFHGPNFTTDAACASALAAMSATIDGLMAHEFDVAITGGVDRNMGIASFVKFCAIGALSPTGTRPYADGADGFIMGEGAALFVVKRLADAIHDGDRIYATVRGVGSASDGKGKGITAPNPVGQTLAVERAWRNAGISPADCTLMEGHGTSTKVGDVVEVTSLMNAFSGAQITPGSIALGSVKSNIGHLKAAAGAAGLLKATYALHDKQMPPSINFDRPNPNLDWSQSPFAVNTELREWDVAPGHSRVAGVSAFGFGGTNFHIVMEDYVPGRGNGNGRRTSAARAGGPPADATAGAVARAPAAAMGGNAAAPVAAAKPPLRGALMLGAATTGELVNELRSALADARQGRHLEPAAPSAEALRAPERIAIDYVDGDELVSKAETALKMLSAGNEAVWPAMRGRGIYRGSGAPGKVAFLYTGQGSQYANMLADLREREHSVAEVFDEADAILAPLLEGRRLSDIIFCDPDDADAVKSAEAELRRTEITQPAVISADTALTRLLSEYGIAPDMVMGHSVGEYGALVASGAMSFPDAMEAVSARGREMASLQIDDPGMMAAVLAPLAEVEKIVADIDGYVVLANINSMHQVVVGGATDAVKQAVAALQSAGHTAIPLPVSHAFHTQIVAPASVPLRAMLARLGLHAPQLPTVANVDGEFYPTGDGAVEYMLDTLSRQVATPVQFVKGLHTLYDAGARVFVEVGPKRALQGFASDVLGDDKVMSLASNHPKLGDIASFNQTLCGLWAAGLGVGREPTQRQSAALQPGATMRPSAPAPAAPVAVAAVAAPVAAAAPPAAPVGGGVTSADDAVARLVSEFEARARDLVGHTDGAPRPTSEPVVITGASLGLPGAERLFDDDNIARLLNGEQGIDVIPARLRREMLDKHITRLVKGEDGGATWETIDRLDAVIKLAARAGAFDLAAEFGVDDDRLAALGRNTQLAIAAGIDALRDAGIPLVLHYKTTTRGTLLPDRWGLPDDLRDDTGIIYAAALPGLEEMADEAQRYTADRMRRERLAALESLRARMLDHDGTDQVVLAEVERRIHEVSHQLEADPYVFNRRFLFRILSMGHSQFAELIGARGPNTQINSACASTTQAVAIAEDWIRNGRCRRVIIIASDDATSDTMMGWIGAGFLATGAAATDELVEEAALPFDARRHGMIIGMGAAGLVVEAADSARERGLTPICEVLGSVDANSAFHGTRLDVEHISGVMEKLVRQGEARGLRRSEIARQTVFVSHETYTPARGGSAAAEIHALRDVFGADADQIVIANVKGMTGHPMGVGLEDVLAVKALETGVVPAVPNFRDPDPELGILNLSRGGAYPVQYALRLAAGFGSQIAMLLLRWTPVADGRRRSPDELGYRYRISDRGRWTAWLQRVSGQTDPSLEVVNHRLRVTDAGAAAQTQPPAPAVAPPAPAPVAAAPAPVAAAPAPVPAAVAPAPAPVAPAPPAPAPAPVAAAPAAAAPAPAPAPAAPAAPADDGVAARVLEIVAAQTGYPPDLLDMDLDLEADLGIDTVKQAEVFAALRETYAIERDDNLKLRDYPTLNHIARFIRDRAGIPTPEAAPAAAAAPAPAAPAAAPAAAAPVATAPAPAAESAAAPAADGVVAKVLEIVAAQTGYPPELLDLDLDLEADLGIDTVKQAEVFAALRETYAIDRDDNLKLRDYPTLNHIARFIRDRAGIPTPEAAPAAAAAPAPAAPAAAAPAPAPAPQAAAPAAAAIDGVMAKVLEIVAAQTGYPPELLDLDLDLEADLGIDTVKQAEVFAALRESYGIERDDALKLRDYPTLNHVAGFIRDRAGIAAPAPAAAAPAPAPAAAPVAVATPAAAPAPADEVVAKVLEVVAAQTGYPPELLDLDLDLEADLGIDTVKQAEVFAALRESYGIERDDNLKLRDYPTLNHVAGFIRDRAGIAAPAPAAAPAAAAPATAPPTSAAAAPAPAAAETPAEAPADEVVAKVLEIVTAQTGYPPELLDFNLDLEADLGIDTVKQAEVFAALRESYGIERDDNLKLRDYPTLNDVANFIRERAHLTNGNAPAAAGATEATEATDDTTTTAEVDEASFPRRVPAPVLRPPLALCVDSGVTLAKGSRVVVMPDAGGVATALTRSLKRRGVEVLTIKGAPDRATLEQTLAEWTEQGAIDGVYWLPALDDEGPLADLTAEQRTEALHARVKLAAVTMRALTGERMFFVSATRLGGRHGYDEPGATSVLGGAVTGFTKAIAQERPDALVKAIDVTADHDAAAVTQILVDETKTDPGAVEIGYADELRWSVGLIEVPAEHEPERDLTKATTFLVTGAAGSIVEAIVADLAPAAGGATFHLLDLVGAPDRKDPDVAKHRADLDGLKRDLAERIKAEGKRPTPKLIERELARIERASVAIRTIEHIEAAGGKAIWHQVDLTDAGQVAAAVAAVREATAEIDTVIHCAGLEISHPLPDKPQSEYDLVFDVKAHGYLNLLTALQTSGEVPKSVVVFSSIAGRFGNRGQTDYSAANDLLCKSVSHMRQDGRTRGIAIDWTAWAQIGMAARGSIPTIMKAAGIDMLPPSIGSTVVRRELTATGNGTEVVVAGALGILLEPRHVTGGIDPAKATAAVTDEQGPMIGQITAFAADGTLTVTTELDPGRQPFLNDHRIDGTAVLPGVMGMEGFAETASALTGGFEVVELQNVDLMAPFKFYRDEPRTLTLTARLRDGGGGTLVADCEMIGRRTLRGDTEQETRHFSGRVRLARKPLAAPKSEISPATHDTGESGVDQASVYEIYFHGPAYQVLDHAWRENGSVIGTLAADLPENHDPADRPTKLSPRLIELCFQTAGVWEIGTTGRMALPMHVDRVVRYRTSKKASRMWAVVTPRESGVDAEIVDQGGHVRIRLEGYRTSELPGDLDAKAVAPLRTAMSGS